MSKRSPINPINVHQHDVANFMTCRLKFWLSFVKGYQPRVQPTYINIGRVFSKVLEQLHLNNDIGRGMAYIDALQEQLKQKSLSREKMDNIDTDGAMLQAMLNGYKEMFVDGNLAVIEPELRLEFPFPQNKCFNYVCRLDGLKDKRKILEDKTTAKIEKGLIKHLPTNFQINSYWLAAQKNGYAVDGVLYRFTQKAAIRQKKTETAEQFQRRIMLDYIDRKDHYFYEEELMFDTAVIGKFEKNLYKIFDDILKCYETGEWYYEGTGCRSGFNTSCEFIDYCHNPTQETLETYYEQGETHEYAPPKSELYGRLRKNVAQARIELMKARIGK